MHIASFRSPAHLFVWVVCLLFDIEQHELSVYFAD